MSKEKAKSRKMNTYLKFALLVAAGTAAGGVVGFLTGYLGESGSFGHGAELLAGGLILFFQRNFSFVIGAAALATVFYDEWFMRKVKRLAGLIIRSEEDEETDHLEYEMERMECTGTIVNTLSMVLTMLVLGTTYSRKYILSATVRETVIFLAGLAVFLFLQIYIGVWQIRFVKFVQKQHPEKRGDPASMKFQKQWVESCDEAEKERIYQSCYKTFLLLMQILPVLEAAALISQILWNTGLMAVVMVGFLWILVSVTYCRSCVSKMKEELRR